MFAVVKPHRANKALHIGLLITAIILSLLSITSTSAEDINCGTHTFACTTSTFIITPAIGGSRVIYVDADATGINNGDSWTNAFTNVQDALNIADTEDEIWVASGTYIPTFQSDLADPRTATFQMKNGVAIYGGFDPSTGDDEFTERDWENNVTVLSGDIGVKGDNSDNCYHVFYHLENLELNTSAILDGFTISDGNSSVYKDGGGMYNRGGSPTVTNCEFKENRALSGGGMYNFNASPIITKCTFNDNRSGMDSGGGGGAMYNDNSSPTVADCSFSNNFSSRGGAIRNYNNSSPTITNCDFSNNSAIKTGGAIRNDDSSPIIVDCTFAYNLADDAGAAINNLNSPPIIINSIFLANDMFSGAMSNFSAPHPSQIAPLAVTGMVWLCHVQRPFLAICYRL